MWCPPHQTPGAGRASGRHLQAVESGLPAAAGPACWGVALPGAWWWGRSRVGRGTQQGKGLEWPACGRLRWAGMCSGPVDAGPPSSAGGGAGMRLTLAHSQVSEGGLGREAVVLRATQRAQDAPPEGACGGLARSSGPVDACLPSSDEGHSSTHFSLAHSQVDGGGLGREGVAWRATQMARNGPPVWCWPPGGLPWCSGLAPAGLSCPAGADAGWHITR